MIGDFLIFLGLVAVVCVSITTMTIGVLMAWDYVKAWWRER
jgi:hypothetical protein